MGTREVMFPLNNSDFRPESSCGVGAEVRKKETPAGEIMQDL